MSSAPFRLLSRYHSKSDEAAAGDGIPEGQCGRCGFQGDHAGPVECITALRDRIAILEFMTKVHDGGLRRKRRSHDIPMTSGAATR